MEHVDLVVPAPRREVGDQVVGVVVGRVGPGQTGRGQLGDPRAERDAEGLRPYLSIQVNFRVERHRAMVRSTTEAPETQIYFITHRL